jgi:periodic tryptophan protein 1
VKEDLSDIEDFTIRETDALIIATHNEEDISYLDVFIYEESEENLYVHHDIILPAFPLSVAWLDYGIGKEEKGLK